MAKFRILPIHGWVTTRNKLVIDYSDYNETVDRETDTLYEICDAEFTSDKEVSEAYERLNSKSGIRFKNYIRKLAVAVAHRENLLYSHKNAVAEAILQDYRRSTWQSLI